MDTIHAVCPKCGEQIQKRFADLKTGDAFPCPKCGEPIKPNPQAMRSAEREIDKGVEGLKNALGKIKGFKPRK